MTRVVSLNRGRDALACAAAALASLAVYTATLQPDFGGPEDTPKFQFIGYVLGIPHPPGYPLYVLLSHVFVKLATGPIAYRANLFSAVTAAAACAVAYVIARQLGSRRWPAWCAAMGLATGASFWRSAVFAEVYGLAAFMAALTIALLLAWGVRPTASRLLASVGAFAAGIGNHLTIAGLAPAYGAYVWWRGRRMLTVRLIGAAAVVMVLGAMQYGLIIIRTRQNAPYLEARANSLLDLIPIVTAARFAGQRFAFGPMVLLTDHLPALVSLIAREFGLAGVLGFVAGGAAAIRTRRAEPLVVLGAAAGMFGMVLNISGDLKGFITPLMALLWPFSAVGITALAELGARRGGAAAGAIVTVAAISMPAVNVITNYRDSDQSGHTEEARFLRAAFHQLPGDAAFVPEDYWSDMALHYFRFTGEAGGGRALARVGFDAAEVRDAARRGQRVFALANAAAFLGAEGLRFRRITIEGPPLDDWLKTLEHGSLVAGALAYAPPPDLTAIGHRDARPAGRPRPFETFAAVVNRHGAAWLMSDDTTSLRVDAGALGTRLPSFSDPVVAAADASGARIDFGGRTIARGAPGLALALFLPDGTLARTLEFPANAARRVSYDEAVYELAGESPCVELNDQGWTDVTPALVTGGWVATTPETGQIVVEMLFPGARGIRVRSSLLLGDGSARTAIVPASTGDAVTSELTRSGERRPVFRIAIDRIPGVARARVKASSTRAHLKVCADEPVRPLFDEGATTAVLRPDFESEARFGAGWSDAERTPAGAIRHGDDGATLLLDLAPAHDYRFALDVVSGGEIVINVNGSPAATCDAALHGNYEVVLHAADVRSGLNSVTFRIPRDDHRDGDRHMFTLRGARLSMEPAGVEIRDTSR